eukprot:15470794-Alexandrium_andersonii.AAC.1
MAAEGDGGSLPQSPHDLIVAPEPLNQRQTRGPADPRTQRPAKPQTTGAADRRARRPVDLRTRRPVD